MKSSNYQQKIFFGPVQVDNSLQNKSDLMDQQAHEEVEDGEHHDNNMYYDQEHLMTEQDFEGHQHQEEEYSHEQDSDNQNDADEDPDDDPDQQYEEDEDEKQEEGEQMSYHSEEQNSQEGNVPISSQSISPDKDNHGLAKRVFQNQEAEEEVRDSNLRISNNTGAFSSSYNDLPLNNGNIIVERSDRFVIFKMVPQNNQSQVKQSQNSIMTTNATPAMGEKYRAIQNYKLQNHCLEEISSDEENKILDEQREYDFNQDYSNLNLDLSCQDDYLHSISQNDIKSLKNNLNNQSMSLNKPPIIKRQTTDGAGIKKQPHKLQSAISLNHRNQNSNKGIIDLEERQSKHDAASLQLKKSFTDSRSSSDKFNRLQKLEKKNLQEEVLDGAEFTIVKGKQQQQFAQNSNQQPFDKSPGLIEPIRLNERRQSDSIVIRNSVIQQQNIFMQLQNAVSTQVSNINTANTADNDTTSHDPETELLKLEYMKLKKIMSKLKQEPQKTARKNQPKNGKQEELYQMQQQLKSLPQTIKQSQRLEENKGQIKSIKNFKLGQDQYTTSNLLSQNISDEDSKKPQYVAKHNKGVYSQQQSTKAKDGRNKNLFKQDQSKLMKRDQSKNKKSARASPNRQVNKKPVKTQQRNPSKYKNKNNDSNSEDSFNRSDSNSSSNHDQSYRTYNKGQQNQAKLKMNIKSQGKPSRKTHQQKQQSDSSHESEGSFCNSDCDHDQSANYRGHHHNQTYHNNDSQSSEEHINSYDSRDQIQNQSYCEEEQDSNEYSESSDSNDGHSHERRKRRAQQAKASKKGDKSGRHTVKASHKDRKLKININMNGAQLSRQTRKEMHNSQEEYLQKQRQMLQQQQYLLAMAQQYPPQQLIMQQQLAMQQQILMQQQQPTLQQNQFLNMQNMQSTNNLALNFELLNQQQMQQQHIQAAQSIPSISNLSNNVSMIMKSNQQRGEDFKSQEDQSLRVIQKNFSGTNLHKLPQQTGISNNRPQNAEMKDFSPQRQLQKINYVGNPQSNLLSPRDLSNSHRQTDSQSNYLNLLKNRFLTGNQAINSDYENNIISRNQTNQITQNNSSPSPIQPLRNQQRDTYQQDTYTHQQQQQQQQQFKLNDYSNRFEEARKYVVDSQYYNQESQLEKHARTNSLMDTLNERRFLREENPQISHTFKLENRDYHGGQENEQPTLSKYQQSKKTADFANFRSENASPFVAKKQDNELFSKAKDLSISPKSDSNENCSMDEGVKASNAHQSVLKSPRTSNKDFQIKVIRNTEKREAGKVQPDSFKADLAKKNQSQKPVQRSSNHSKAMSTVQSPAKNKQLQGKQTNDQDKKGPQALWIGFEDETQLKDPFLNKPALKARQLEQQIPEKSKDFIQRSKSTKGAELKTTLNTQRQTLQQRRSKEKNANADQAKKANPEQEKKSNADQQKLEQQQKKKNNDEQPSSSHKNDQNSKQKQLNILQKESPLKRVVYDMKQKDAPSAKEQQQQKKNPSQQQKNIIVNINDEDEEEVIDPSHNKNIVIEILDKKKGQPKKEVSLAEMFKAKMKQAELIVQQQQDQDDQDDQGQDKPVKKEKSKEELAELRKKMMKSRVKSKADNFTSGNNDGSASVKMDILQDQKGNKKEPKDDLMSRLAHGQKVQVDQKEMKKLTTKNYQNLPEIKRKKEEEKKKQEHQARKAAAVEYNKVLNEKRRALLKKKKSVNGDD